MDTLVHVTYGRHMSQDYRHGVAVSRLRRWAKRRQDYASDRLGRKAYKILAKEYGIWDRRDAPSLPTDRLIARYDQRQAEERRMLALSLSLAPRPQDVNHLVDYASN